MFWLFAFALSLFTNPLMAANHTIFVATGGITYDGESTIKVSFLLDSSQNLEIVGVAAITSVADVRQLLRDKANAWLNSHATANVTALKAVIENQTIIFANPN
jgi:hypothetical protein